MAAGRAGISWGMCNFRARPKESIPGGEALRGCSGGKYRCPPAPGLTCWHRPTSWLVDGLPWGGQVHPSNPYHNKALFAIVRNPYTRLVSEFYSTLQKTEQTPESLNENLQGRLLGVQRGNLPFNDHLFPQAHHIFALTLADKNNLTARAYPLKFNSSRYDYSVLSKEQIVDHVLFHENLSEQFETLMKEYELPIELPKPETNNGEEKKLTYQDLDEKTINLINELYKDDFDLLGYRRIYPRAPHWQSSYNPSSILSDPSSILSQ